MKHKRATADRILDYLATGRSLTPLQALSKFGILRLGARVHQLRQQGHDILTDTAVIGRKRVARYVLAGVR